MSVKNYTLSVLTAAIVRRPVIRVLIARSIEVTAVMKYNSNIAARLRSMESIEKYAEKSLKNVSGKPQLTGDHKHLI